jgi:uncharacterized membrane protein
VPLPVSRSLLVNLMGLAVGLLVAITVIGLVALWPHGKLGGTALGLIHTEGATVEAVRQVPCGQLGAHGCRHVDIKVTSGPRKGLRTSFTVVGEIKVLALAPGDHIRVYPNKLPPGARTLPGQKLGPYNFSDFDRGGAMFWLAIAFAALLLFTARLRGLRALAGLGLSLLIIVAFVIPAILHGKPPVEVALVGALAVILVTMPLTYGFGPKMIAALVGTALSLFAAAALADVAARFAHLSGASSDEALYIASTQSSVSLRGLLVAGMVIGALGVLIDLTVSQSSTVLALRRANPALGFAGLFREAIDVGHDHISATVNTLVLAYAGAALPVLLIFSIGHTSFTDAVNGEAVAQEVIASLVGSIGLILSMPLTTALAALLAERMSPAALSHEHSHAH